MSNKPAPEQEIALYDAIGRAIANLHAALAEIDAAWVIVTAERQDTSVGDFAALDAAEQILGVARGLGSGPYRAHRLHAGENRTVIVAI
jgi:predicted trehalose synthase